MNDDALFKLLLDMNAKLGELAQGAESRRNQVATLFDEVKEIRTAIATSNAAFTAQSASVASLDVKVSDVRKECAEIRHDIDTNIKPVTSILSNAKTKGLAVLAFIALMGGTAGGQAEKILGMILGRPG